METEKLFIDAIRDGIRKGVTDRLTQSYNNPIDTMLKEVLASHDATFRAMLNDSLTAAMNDDGFREQIRAGVRHTLAKTLVARFGGELEKQVNVLKSDPLTRARITTAIDEIVKERIGVAGAGVPTK